ncbi:hypothetical protein F5B20DRAFT_594933 [Whalleya microplaca]|nr:hypothetical protein F5B20DRAFT_594933 [Whalleya microplaca]
MASGPSMIILALWPSVSRRQIEHYAKDYSILYPAARVGLVFKSSIFSFPLSDSPIEYDNLTWVTDPNTAKPLYPSGDDSVLLHIFGKTAAVSACSMLRSYYDRTGKALNIKVVVFDAAPIPTKLDLINTILQSDYLFTSTCYQTMLYMDWARRLWFEYSAGIEQTLGDEHLVPSSARRCYVCPATDTMLSWKEGVGDSPSHRQEFHVNRQAVDHLRWNSHRERYWAGIECVWSGKDD